MSTETKDAVRVTIGGWGSDIALRGWDTPVIVRSGNDYAAAMERAEYIARAVNAHDALLDACRIADTAFRAYEQAGITVPRNEALEKIRAAITLATEGR